MMDILTYFLWISSSLFQAANSTAGLMLTLKCLHPMYPYTCLYSDVAFSQECMIVSCKRSYYFLHIVVVISFQAGCTHMQDESCRAVVHYTLFSWFIVLSLAVNVLHLLCHVIIKTRRKIIVHKSTIPYWTTFLLLVLR